MKKKPVPAASPNCNQLQVNYLRERLRSITHRIHHTKEQPLPPEVAAATDTIKRLNRRIIFPHQRRMNKLTEKRRSRINAASTRIMTAILFANPKEALRMVEQFEAQVRANKL